MSDSINPAPNDILSLCYRLYQDPIYRHVYFPQRNWSESAALSEALFVRACQSLPGSTELSDLEQAIYRAITALERLSQVEQMVLLLRLVEGRPYREIAQVVNRSEGACHVIHYRALSTLTTLLHEKPAPRDYANV